MDSYPSITKWIGQLRAGDRLAANRLWQTYYDKLIRLARHRLGNAPRRVADEEDVVATALESLFRGVEAGRFPDVTDRDDLWRLLMVVTERKAYHLKRDQAAQKRGGGRVAGETELTRSDGAGFGLEAFPAPEPTPEFLASMNETIGQMFGVLDEDLQAIATLKMQGHTNREISEHIGRAVPTVERRLRLIRAKWSEFG